MLAWIVIVDHDLNDFIFAEDEGVGVVTVHLGIGCRCARSYGGVEGWHDGRGIRDVVEKRAGYISIALL